MEICLHLHRRKAKLFGFSAENLVPLCNGSTADFGSVSLGSNPSGTTTGPGNIPRPLRKQPYVLSRHAQVVELVDTLVSGTSGLKAVQVRVLSWVQKSLLSNQEAFLLITPLCNSFSFAPRKKRGVPRSRGTPLLQMKPETASLLQGQVHRR